MRSALGVLLMGLAAAAMAQPAAVRVVEGLDDPARWRLQVSEGAQARLSRVGGADGGRALCLQVDFGALPGSARLQTPWPVTLPADAVVLASGRGQAGQAQLSMQLLDAQGRRFGGHRSGRELGPRWQQQAWYVADFTDARGNAIHLPLQARTLELHLASAAGGKAQWCMDRLAVQARPADNTPFAPVALADTATALQQRMVDGRNDTLWVSSGVKQQTVSLDLGREREVGGLLVQWAAGLRADKYQVQASADGRRWEALHRVDGAAGNTDRLRLGPLSARYLRLDLEDGPNWRYGIVELMPQPAAFGRSTEAFLAEVGKQWPAGILPASLHGGPVSWTVLGAQGALAPAWFSDQGVIEPQPGSFTLEPQLQIDGQWLGAGQMAVTPQWQPGGAHTAWQHGKGQLEITAATGTDGQGQPWLRVRYRLANPDRAAHRYALAVAVRPFQLHPAGRLGDLPGGPGWIEQLALGPGLARVNGAAAVLSATPAEAQFASNFDAGLALNLLRGAQLPERAQATDAQGLASGVMLWRKELAAGAGHEWELWLPMSAQAAARTVPPSVFHAQPLAGEGWILPGSQGRALVQAWQSALARMQAERAGPWLRADSRRAIGAGNRDAMAIAGALLRADQADAVMPWLLARITSGSTGNCTLLAHWGQLGAQLQAAQAWPPAQLQALQPWLHSSQARYLAGGSCAAEPSAALVAAQLGQLLPPVVTAVVDPATPAASGLPAAVALPAAPAADAVAGPGPETVGMPVPAAPQIAPVAILPPGEAVTLAQRQQIWEGALAQLDDQLPAGWQRWVRGQSRGLLDARQGAEQVQAIAATVVQEQQDHLRLLPGLPAEAWRDGRLQVPGLLTRWGRLGLQGRRDGQDWVLQFAPGLGLPPAGLVLDWPFATPPAAAQVDGQPLDWQGGRLHLLAVPGELRIRLPAG